jgi:hypothetical protein
MKNFRIQLEFYFISIFQINFNSDLWPMGIPKYFIRCNHEYILKTILNFFIILR